MVEAQYTTVPAAIFRLRTELYARSSDGAHSIQVSHRALAAAIGCSPGRIPTLMQQLEERREIEREPIGRGYTIRVLRVIVNRKNGGTR